MTAVAVDARLISLASGVLPEFTPQETARAAAKAGFKAVGLWALSYCLPDSVGTTAVEWVEGRALDQLGVEHDLTRRWGERPAEAGT